MRLPLPPSLLQLAFAMPKGPTFREIAADWRSVTALLLPLLQAAERMDLWGDGADGVTAAARKEAFDAPLLPLVTLQYVCEVEAEAARQMREEVFPAAERSQATIPKPDRPLPEGATLREHLLKQMTASQMVLKKVCADLVFAMCEEDVSDFVTLTGIGNAAGLLQERNLFAAMAGAAAQQG